MPVIGAQRTSGCAARVDVDTRRASSPIWPIRWATAATVFSSSVQRVPLSRAQARACRACLRISASASRSRSSVDRHPFALHRLSDVVTQTPRGHDVDVPLEDLLEVGLEAGEPGQR